MLCWLILDSQETIRIGLEICDSSRGIFFELLQDLRLLGVLFVLLHLGTLPATLFWHGKVSASGMRNKDVIGSIIRCVVFIPKFQIIFVISDKHLSKEFDKRGHILLAVVSLRWNRRSGNDRERKFILIPMLWV